MAKKKAPPAGDEADPRQTAQADARGPTTRCEVVASLKALMRPELCYTLRGFLHGRLLASVAALSESPSFPKVKSVPGMLAFFHEALDRAKLEIALLYDDANEAARLLTNPLARTYHKAVAPTDAGRKTGGG